MQMRSGCSLLGVVVALVCGMLGASRAEAGFKDLTPPGPTASYESRSHRDFTPRCDVPDLKLDSAEKSDGCTTAVDLPDAWDFRHGKKHEGEDHLIARLTDSKPHGKTSYSLFWEDTARTIGERGFSDLGVDVKSSAPVVVPLPPGVWAGLVGLLCVITFQIRRHRRQLV